MKYITMTAAALVLAGCQMSNQAPARILHPVERCGYVQVPVYGVLDRPASNGEVVGGAVIGGVIGNHISNGDNAGTLIGALIGGAIAGDQRKQERVIVDQATKYRCQTVYQ
tara:strand:- start:216 stop:548 length:333 start_codon:yes stop_codon:yes gene_type:complete